MKKVFTSIVLVLAVLVQGCNRYGGVLPQTPAPTTSQGDGGNSNSPQAPAPKAPTPEMPTVPLKAEFGPLQQLVFSQKCLRCHQSEFASYKDLMAATTEGGSPFIVPGSAQTSEIYIEIAAGRMPKKGGPLTAEQITAVRDWIDAGAQENLTPSVLQ